MVATRRRDFLRGSCAVAAGALLSTGHRPTVAAATAPSDRDVLTQENRPPTAGFSYTPTDPIAGEPITFDASESTDPDGEIVEYRWDFYADSANEATAEGERVEFTYDMPEEWGVELVIVDDGGAESRAKQAVRVWPREDKDGEQFPTPRFTYTPDDPAVGETITFDASESSSPNGEIVEYRWDFYADSANEATAEGREVRFAYDRAEVYTVALEVVDETGTSNRRTGFVSVGGATDSPAGDGTSADDTGGSGSDSTARASGGGSDGERRRGFFSNGGDEPEVLTNVFNLTVFGFMLSVAGIVHQMVSG